VTGRLDLKRIGLMLAAPMLAVVLAAVITSVVLLVTGDNPLTVLSVFAESLARPSIIVNTLNKATTYYLSALAVAVGFRMNLFNIGVDGQYRLATMLAAALGGAVVLPGPLHVLMIVVTAMLVGAMWAGLAALLKVTRGISEVISTIMLNSIATAIVAYLLHTDRLAVGIAGSNNIGTRPIPESGRIPGLDLLPDAPNRVFGFIVVAAVAGIGYHLLLNRTRFGFDLRAAGQSESAARASGVNVTRMILFAMLISGALAGLVGMPQLLGASYTYALDFPAGLGFTGIAIALLGRNHPVGIAFAALFWGFLDTSAIRLAFADVAPELVKIMQGTIVLCVVVAYELVRRYGLRRQQKEVGARLAEQAEPEGAPA
jgi:ABC-type uncharacterized transport system permease subunit